MGNIPFRVVPSVARPVVTSVRTREKSKGRQRQRFDDVVIVSGYRYLFPTALTVDFHRLAKEYGYRHSIATRRRRFVYTMYIQNCTAVSAPPYIFTAFRVST